MDVVNVDEAITQVSKDISVALRDKQHEAIRSFCTAIFVSLPTGYGKTLIFAMLPLVFDKLKGESHNGRSIAVCISPLSAIMIEQTARLNSLGILTQFVGEAQNDPDARHNVLKGQMQVVLISPENAIENPMYRNMFLSASYKQRMVALIVDEAHCVRTWGDQFRRTFSMIGQLRSLIPENINVMALTGTATKNTFDAVLERLGMWDPVVVGVSSNRLNIKLVIQPNQKLEEFSLEISQRIKNEGLNYPKTIVFCRNYKDCTGLYLSLVEKLRENLTNPPGYPDLLQYRYVTMYTRASTGNMKELVIDLFSKPNSTLRLILATAALSMGVDCPDVRQVIHWGIPSTIEQYVQEIGRAGRDNLPSQAILINGKISSYSEIAVKRYVENNSNCRRSQLYKQFLMYEESDTVTVDCCDICDSRMHNTSKQ